MINLISMPTIGHGTSGTSRAVSPGSQPWGTTVYTPKVRVVAGAAFGAVVGADAARGRARPPRGEPR